MSCGGIGDMDIVAYRSPVRRVEVIPENCEVADMPLQRHHRARDEVSFGIPEFADRAGGISSAGIEIAKAKGIQPIGTAIISKDPLDHPLRSTIGIDCGARRPLSDRIGSRISIHCSGAREDESGATMFEHRL